MKKYTPHIGYHDIIENCTQSDCPICRIGKKAVNTYLSMVLYECVTNPDIREQLWHSLGYCRTHAWLLPKIERGNLLGIAIIYEDLLGIVKKRISLVADESQRPSLFRKIRTLFRRKQQALASQVQQRCPACVLQEDIETIALNVMLKALAKQDEKMRQALRTSEGFCFLHSKQALELSRNKGVRDILIGIMNGKIEHIRASLKEFIRKHDHRFQHEQISSERDSWKWAIQFLVGEESPDGDIKKPRTLS